MLQFVYQYMYFPADEGEADLSGLTQGGVICGNPSKALRSRRGNKPTSLRSNPKLLQQVGGVTPRLK